MFRIKVADAKILKDMITAISTIVDEATYTVSSDGLKLRSMDPSRVAMVDFEWPKFFFDEYVCSETMRFCINVSELLKILRRTRRGESVEISLDETSGKLQMKIKGNYVRTFSIPTLEPVEEEVPTPKVTFNAKAEITTEGLSQAIRNSYSAQHGTTPNFAADTSKAMEDLTVQIQELVSLLKENGQLDQAAAQTVQNTLDFTNNIGDINIEVDANQILANFQAAVAEMERKLMTVLKDNPIIGQSVRSQYA